MNGHQLEDRANDNVRDTPCTINVNGIHLMQVNKLNYLDTWVPSDGKCIKKIEKRKLNV